MTRAAHALLLQLVEHRFEHFGPIAETLHADRALRLHVAHPAAPFFRLRQRRLRLEERIGEDARRRDLVALAALLLADAPLDAVAAARIADRGDAVAHPQLVNVGRRHALLFPTDVRVHVDEPGHHVVTAQIDLASAGGELRTSRLFLHAAGRAYRHDPHDAIALDDDVGRAERRRAGAVDHGRVAQNELRIRTVAFLPRRRRRHFRLLRLGCRTRQARREPQADQAAEKEEAHEHSPRLKGAHDAVRNEARRVCVCLAWLRNPKPTTLGT